MDNFEYIERLPSEDADWSDDDWRILISYLVDNGLVSYMEIASLFRAFKPTSSWDFCCKQ